MDLYTVNDKRNIGRSEINGEGVMRINVVGFLLKLKE
jgi:hypothetical protein